MKILGSVLFLACSSTFAATNGYDLKMDLSLAAESPRRKMATPTSARWRVLSLRTAWMSDWRSARAAGQSPVTQAIKMKRGKRRRWGWEHFIILDPSIGLSVGRLE